MHNVEQSFQAQGKRIAQLSYQPSTFSHVHRDPSGVFLYKGLSENRSSNYWTFQTDISFQANLFTAWHNDSVIKLNSKNIGSMKWSILDWHFFFVGKNGTCLIIGPWCHWLCVLFGYNWKWVNLRVLQIKNMRVCSFNEIMHLRV